MTASYYYTCFQCGWEQPATGREEVAKLICPNCGGDAPRCWVVPNWVPTHKKEVRTVAVLSFTTKDMAIRCLKTLAVNNVHKNSFRDTWLQIRRVKSCESHSWYLEFCQRGLFLSEELVAQNAATHLAASLCGLKTNF